jgi:hypothetical protein
MALVLYLRWALVLYLRWALVLYLRWLSCFTSHRLCFTSHGFRADESLVFSGKR